MRNHPEPGASREENCHGSPDRDGSVTDHVVFDAHSDLPFQVVRERESGRESVLESDFLPGMRAGGVGMRVAAIYVDDAYLPEMALHRALAALTELRADIGESEGVALATTADEFGRADTALVLGMEGAEPLMGDPRLLDTFYRSGVRVLTLTHSRRNAVGDGAVLSGSRRGTPGGLSETGLAVLERAQALGILVDLSHLNEPGFEDAIAASEKPVIASHSNCRALCDHPRNLTDEAIRAIAATGGVVCLTAVGSFLGNAPDLGSLCDHVEHAVDVAGPEHVGLGFDFFSYLLEYLSEQERARLADISAVEGLDGDEAVARVPAALGDRGFSETEITAICQKNLRRAFRQVI
jgi:membrane dipeptidase